MKTIFALFAFLASASAFVPQQQAVGASCFLLAFCFFFWSTVVNVRVDGYGTGNNNAKEQNKSREGDYCSDGSDGSHSTCSGRSQEGSFCRLFFRLLLSVTSLVVSGNSSLSTCFFALPMLCSFHSTASFLLPF
jgi:hypothetical protein